MASTFGNWSMPYWSGLASAQRSADQLYRDWLISNAKKSTPSTQTSLSPLEQVQQLTGVNLSEGDYSGGSNGDGTSESSSPGPSSGLGHGMASAIGAGIGIAGQYGGMPGTVTGPIGSAVGAALEGKTPGEVGYAAAKSAAAAMLGKAVPGIGLALGVANMFGIDPFAELASYLNVDNDLPIGFGYSWGMQRQKDDAPIPGIDNLSDALADRSENVDSLSDMGYGYSSPTSTMSSVPGRGWATDINDFGVTFGTPDTDSGISSGGGPTNADGNTTGGGPTGGGPGPGANGGEDGGASDGNSWAQGGLVQYHRGCRC